jgi:hypothetical protein
VNRLLFLSWYNRIIIIMYITELLANNFKPITCPNLITIFFTNLHFFSSVQLDLSSKNSKKRFSGFSILRACMNFFLFSLFLVQSWIKIEEICSVWQACVFTWMEKRQVHASSNYGYYYTGFILDKYKNTCWP